MTRPDTTPQLPPPRADRLSDSIAIVLLMTLLQRTLGFCRGVIVCRWLEPSQLGTWDMALGFLELAAPLAVLGIPGSFGRYVEFYRSRGQFRAFLARTSLLTCVLGIAAVAIIVWQSSALSRLVFGTPDHDRLMLQLAAGLAVLIAYNFVSTLLTALRRSRIVSVLEFISSMVFAIMAVLLLGVVQMGASSILWAYTSAGVVSLLLGVYYLRKYGAQADDDTTALGHRALWTKLLPFAVWVWGTNWLANLFELADRYMIVHYGGFEPLRALAEVGNYHSSRIVPLLLVSVTALLGTVITPYLSHDWEVGGRKLVSARLNLTMKLLSLILLCGAVAILITAPVLFGVAFKGKYAHGLAVLPITLLYCLWLGLARVGQKYLWCAERVQWAAGCWLLGLLVNIGLNLVLLPRYGLHGVVLATAAGNLVALVLIGACNALFGMRVHLSTCLLAMTPLALVCGPAVASVLLVVLLVASAKSSLLFTAWEKQQLKEVLDDYMTRLRCALGRPKPQPSAIVPCARTVGH